MAFCSWALGPLCVLMQNTLLNQVHSGLSFSRFQLLGMRCNMPYDYRAALSPGALPQTRLCRIAVDVEVLHQLRCTFFVDLPKMCDAACVKVCNLGFWFFFWRSDSQGWGPAFTELLRGTGPRSARQLWGASWFQAQVLKPSVRWSSAREISTACQMCSLFMCFHSSLFSLFSVIHCNGNVWTS